MTLEEFKNLKVGDEIVFRSKIYKCNIQKNNWKAFEEIETGTDILALSLPLQQPTVLSYLYNKTENIVHFTSEQLKYISIYTKHIQKSEKELIQEQIKTLQDKLIEIEKNDVENVIKNLITGQFIEVIYKDSFDPSPYIYRFDNIYNKNLTIYSYKLEQSWEINPETISKIIVRNDIKEAYDKFISFVKSTD